MQKKSPFIIVCALLLLCAGCARTPTNAGPGQKVQAFIHDLEAGNYQNLWSSLSEKTRERLQKEKGGEEGFKKSLEGLLGDRESRDELKKTAIVSEEARDASATVVIKFPALKEGGHDRFKQFTLCKEGGEWKIERLESIER
jgi:hypothetical protein